MNRAVFYAAIRKNPFKSLTVTQVAGMEAILDEWERRKLTDLRWLAYVFATAYWETAHTMQPIREYGLGKGKKYGVPDPKTKQVYYGRGFVQLTWLANYQTMARLLGVDLVNNPDLALDLKIAIQILFEGMLRAVSLKGDFTGKALEDFFNDMKTDWVGARKIINGTDYDDEIAEIAKLFYAALQAAAKASPVPVIAIGDKPATTAPKAPQGPIQKILGLFKR